MKLFNKVGKAKKKWRSKAWIVDCHKTKLTIMSSTSIKPKHVPPWIYRKLQSSINDTPANSNLGKDWETPYIYNTGLLQTQIESPEPLHEAC